MIDDNTEMKTVFDLRDADDTKKDAYYLAFSDNPNYLSTQGKTLL